MSDGLDAARPAVWSKRRPLPDRGGEGAFVQVIELASYRHAVRKSCDLHLRAMQKIRDVMGSGLPIDGGIERENHFSDGRIVRTGHKRINREVLRTDAIER